MISAQKNGTKASIQKPFSTDAQWDLIPSKADP